MATLYFGGDALSKGGASALTPVPALDGASEVKIAEYVAFAKLANGKGASTGNVWCGVRKSPSPAHAQDLSRGSALFIQETP